VRGYCKYVRTVIATNIIRNFARGSRERYNATEKEQQAAGHGLSYLAAAGIYSVV
jgi:hypothetical protein